MIGVMFRIWPGTNGLFRKGRWSFLIIALAFAFCLDGFLIANFFWSEYISVTQRNVGCLILLVVWCGLGQIAFLLEKKLEIVRTADAKQNRFGDAIVQYLQGNWFETECFLGEILKKNPRDVEALLMLATLYRHTNRVTEGIPILLNLRKIEESRKWFIEIETELALSGRELQHKLPEKPTASEPSAAEPTTSPAADESPLSASETATTDEESASSAIQEPFSDPAAVESTEIEPAATPLGVG